MYFEFTFIIHFIITFLRYIIVFCYILYSGVISATIRFTRRTTFFSAILHNIAVVAVGGVKRKVLTWFPGHETKQPVFFVTELLHNWATLSTILHQRIYFLDVGCCCSKKWRLQQQQQWRFFGSLYCTISRTEPRTLICLHFQWRWNVWPRARWRGATKIEQAENKYREYWE
jgi:hypothetical protein